MADTPEQLAAMQAVVAAAVNYVAFRQSAQQPPAAGPEFGERAMGFLHNGLITSADLIETVDAYRAIVSKEEETTVTG